jgi:hypothetical protein
MQEANESCFGAIENTLDITDISIIKVNMEPHTVILFKLGIVMQEGVGYCRDRLESQVQYNTYNDLFVSLNVVQCTAVVKR